MKGSISVHVGWIVVAVGAFAGGRWLRPAFLANVHAVVSNTASSSKRVTMAAPTSGDGEASKLTGPRRADAARRPPHSLAEDDAREFAIEQWAESDARAALRFAQTQLHGDRRAQAFSAALAVWGKNDPDAAWSWVSANLPGALHHFDTLLEVFGKQSTEVAARYAAQLSAEHPEATVEAHLAALLGITYRGDFAGARALVDGNPTLNAEARGTLLNFIAGQWARYDPEAAVAWVATLPAGSSHDQALIGLGESWSDNDPARAAEFAAGLPSGNSRTLAMRQAIAKWVVQDADAARAWVVQNDRHEDFDQAVGAIATDSNLVNRDPMRALRWAATIFDDAQRTKSVSEILFSWYPSDPNGVANYLGQTDLLSAAQKQDLLSRLRGSQ